LVGPAIGFAKAWAIRHSRFVTLVVARSDR
jgi:hypothetical protein